MTDTEKVAEDNSPAWSALFAASKETLISIQKLEANSHSHTPLLRHSTLRMLPTTELLLQSINRIQSEATSPTSTGATTFTSLTTSISSTDPIPSAHVTDLTDSKPSATSAVTAIQVNLASSTTSITEETITPETSTYIVSSTTSITPVTSSVPVHSPPVSDNQTARKSNHKPTLFFAKHDRVPRNK